MRLKPVTWKVVWAVFAVLVVTLGMLSVPRAAAQDAAPTSPVSDDADTEETSETAGEAAVPNPAASTDETTEANTEADPASPVPADSNGEVQAAKPIVFGDVRITNASGNDPNATLRQWSRATFDVDWSAPNGVTNGQVFSIVYPETFTLYNTEDFPLKSEDGIEGGTCHVSQNERSITCTLNEAFTMLDDVRGTLQTQLQTTKALDSREVILMLDGVNTIAYLPGDGVGVIGVQDSFPNEPRKWGWYSSTGNQATWTVNIPGAKLVEAGLNTVHVKDTLGGYKHKFITTPKITEYIAVEQDGKHILTEENARAGVSKEATNVVKNDTTIEFDVTPPNPENQWKADRFYRIVYRTETHDGKLAPTAQVKDGKVVPEQNTTSNKVEVSGQGPFNVATIYRSQLSSGTITGVKRGSYEVTKTVEIADAALIPADVMFNVQAEIYDAAGKSLATEKIALPANGTQSGPKEWKAGTVVVLSELDFPEIPGVKFTDYAFEPGEGTKPEDVELLGGGKSIKLKVVSNANVKVNLVNKAVAVDTDAPFALVKNTAGVDSARNKEFWFNYSCRVPGKDEVKTGEMSVLGNGTVKHSPERFAIGSVCEIVENAQKAGIDGYDLVADPIDFKRTVEITAEPALAKAEFTNTYVRMTGSLAVTKKIDNDRVDAVMRDEEFKFEATWNEHGKTEKREFTMRPRDAYSDFPKLPLGTEVTIREILPERTPWATPQFEGNVAGAVQDHGDGSATVKVLADDARLLVTVTNSIKDPDVPPLGWLGLLAFIPFLNGGSSTGSAGSSSNSTPTTAPNSPAQPAHGGNAAQQTGNGATAAPRQLAQTGASVLGIAAAAIALAGVGVFLVRRSRRNS